MAYLNYSTKTIDLTDDLINVGLNEFGLIIDGQKTTAGAPDTNPGKYIPGAMIINEVTPGTYQNTGSTAVPVWTLMGSGGGGSPGGVNTSVQYNNAGVFGGDTNFIWDPAPRVFYVGDPNGTGNSTSIKLSDASQNIELSTNITSFTSPGGGRVLGRINASAATIQFGDINPLGNNTLFTLDDIAQTVQILGVPAPGELIGLNVDATLATGNAGVLYSNGVNQWGFAADMSNGGQSEIFSGGFTWIWPQTDSVGTQALVSDGAGNLSWASGGGSIGGSIAAGQVAYGSGVDTISGSGDFIWNNATKGFGVGDVTGTQNNTRYILDDLNSEHIFTTPSLFIVQNPSSNAFIHGDYQSGNPIVVLGDYGGFGNGTRFEVDDATRVITAQTTVAVAMGDVNGSGNSTTLTVDDASQTVGGFVNIGGGANSNFFVTPISTSMSLDNGVGGVWGFQAIDLGTPQTQIKASTNTFVWPDLDGNAGDFLSTDGAGNLSFLPLTRTTLTAYADDAAAGVGGLVTGDLYQTSGAGSAPLNAPGIVMIKQ